MPNPPPPPSPPLPARGSRGSESFSKVDVNPPARPPPMNIPKPPTRHNSVDMNTPRSGSVLSQYDFSNYRNRAASTLSDANWDNESVVSSIMDGNNYSSNISDSLSSLQYNSNFSIGSSSESLLPLLKNELETTSMELRDSKKENESLKIALEELKCVMADEYLRYQKHLTAVTGHNGGPLQREGGNNTKREVGIEDNSTVNNNGSGKDGIHTTNSNTIPFVDNNNMSSPASSSVPSHHNIQSSSSSSGPTANGMSSEFTAAMMEEKNARLLTELAEHKERADKLENQLVFAKREREKAIKLLISVVGRDRINRLLHLNAGVPNILDLLIEQLGPSHNHHGSSSGSSNDAKRSSPSKLNTHAHNSSPDKYMHFKTGSSATANGYSNSNSNDYSSRKNESNTEKSPSPQSKIKSKAVTLKRNNKTTATSNMKNKSNQ